MKKGFTLVELLATIILLGLIATLVYTSVNASIDRANKNALKDDLIVIEKTIRNDSVDVIYDTYLNYTYTNGKLYQDGRNIDITTGSKDNNGMGYIDSKGDIEVVINNGKYCATYKDGKTALTNYSSETCKLSNNVAITETPSKCFEVNTDGVLTRYKCYPDNPYGNEVIKDIKIPSEVNGIIIKEIGVGAFSSETILVSAKNTNYSIINSINPMYYLEYNKDIDAKDLDIESYSSVKKLSGFKMRCNPVRLRKNDYILLNDNLNTYFTDSSTIDFNNYGYCTIDESLFQRVEYNGVESISIPNTVTKINDAAFLGNNITSLDIPDSVTYIGKQAFMFNNISKLNIGSSVKDIEFASFYYNKLTNLYIPENVKTIYDRAFASNLITKISFESNNTYYYGSAFSNNRLSGNDALLYKLNPDGTKDTSYLMGYAGSVSTPSVTVPNTVKKINKYAFYGTEIGTINLSEGLDEIGEYAFYDVYSKVNLPSTVSKIGDYAFLYYTKSSITLPSELEEIPRGCFAGAKLTSITIPNEVKKIGEGAFFKNELTSVEIPSTVKYIDRNAFAYNRSLTSLTLNEGLTYIGNGAFVETDLSSLIIPSTVKTLGFASFFNNFNLTTITNKTGRSFVFNDVLFKGSSCNFEKGICSGVTIK